MDCGACDLEVSKFSGKLSTRVTWVEAEASPSSTAVDAGAVRKHDADHPIGDCRSSTRSSGERCITDPPQALRLLGWERVKIFADGRHNTSNVVWWWS